ncbi:hypothetical protein E5K35_001703 [Enterococcus faecalis]|nr:hypothetical protein [Enterococcus faecalis]
MKITIEVTPEEEKELLQAIGSSKEQNSITIKTYCSSGAEPAKIASIEEIRKAISGML